MRMVAMGDDELIGRIAAGDRHALTDLYQRHRGPLSSYLRVFTTDAGVIEEVVQDTMLAVWKGAHRFAGRSSVRSWVFSIARRRAADVFRRKSLRIEADPEWINVADPDPGPESRALSGEAEDDLLMAISSLPTVQREVLMLVFIHGLSYREAAEAIAVPVGTIKSRLNKARQSLRVQIQRRADA